MFRQRPILSIFLIILVAAIGWLSYFFATFDLNSYRELVQRQLSETISQPVTLGTAHLSFKHGPALEFAQIKVGQDATPLLEADHLYLNFEFWPLIKGKEIFSKVELDRPRFHINLEATPAPAEQANAERVLFDQSLWDNLILHALDINQGEIIYHDHRNAERPIDLTIKDFDLQLRELAPIRPGTLQLSGTLVLPDGQSPFSLQGRINPSTVEPRWLDTDWDLQLTCKNLPTAVLHQYVPKLAEQIDPHGKLDADLKINGAAASGLTLSGQLQGEKLTLGLPHLYQQPKSIKRVDLSITYLAPRTGQGHRLQPCQVTADGLTVKGDLDWPAEQADKRFIANLSTPALKISRLLAWLPDAGQASEPVWQTWQPDGSLQVRKLAFYLPQASQPGSSPVVDAIDLTINNGQLNPPDIPPLTGLGVRLHLRNDNLEISDGQANWQGSSLKMTGRITKPWQSDRQLSLEMTGNLATAGAADLLPPTDLPVQLSGDLPLHFIISGSAQDLKYHGGMDLTPLGLQIGGTQFKAPDQAGKLALQGEITPQQVVLEQATVQSGIWSLQGAAQLQLTDERPFLLTTAVSQVELARLQDFFPALERLKLRGQASLSYQWSGTQGKVTDRRGDISLDRVGLHLVKVIADINNANGRILLYPDRATAQSLRLMVGISPLIVSGSVSDFSSPKIQLQVQGKSIRASDLVFNSEKDYLRDLHGGLYIDSNGLDFQDIRLRLDGGTVARVNGTLKNFKAPDVRLTATAEYGNIDEVIGLWANGPPKDTEQDGEQHSTDSQGQPVSRPGRTHLWIGMRAEKGHLGKLHFSNATGELTVFNHLLTIRPLHFNIGEGVCTAQVLVDSRSGTPSLLTASGHAENVDATEIYSQFMGNRGLLSGNMQSDFFVRGRVGKTFLDTSSGGIHLEVKDGVLRKFQFLSKVFSLLNVSQILTLKLPDMSLEGMPFNRLEGSFSLDKGELASQDLFIESNAMNLSLVGKMNLKTDQVDAILGVKPLRTVDKIVTNIPIAGWLLTGKEKALITAHFKISGDLHNPEVSAIPVSSISGQVLGIFKRVLGLPGKVITDPGGLIGGGD